MNVNNECFPFCHGMYFENGKRKQENSSGVSNGKKLEMFTVNEGKSFTFKCCQHLRWKEVSIDENFAVKIYFEKTKPPKGKHFEGMVGRAVNLRLPTNSSIVLTHQSSLYVHDDCYDTIRDLLKTSNICELERIFNCSDLKKGKRLVNSINKGETPRWYSFYEKDPSHIAARNINGETWNCFHHGLNFDECFEDGKNNKINYVLDFVCRNDNFESAEFNEYGGKVKRQRRVFSLNVHIRPQSTLAVAIKEGLCVHCAQLTSAVANKEGLCVYCAPSIPAVAIKEGLCVYCAQSIPAVAIKEGLCVKCAQSIPAAANNVGLCLYFALQRHSSSILLDISDSNLQLFKIAQTALRSNRFHIDESELKNVKKGKTTISVYEKRGFNLRFVSMSTAIILSLLFLRQPHIIVESMKSSVVLKY